MNKFNVWVVYAKCVSILQRCRDHAGMMEWSFPPTHFSLPSYIILKLCAKSYSHIAIMSLATIVVAWNVATCTSLVYKSQTSKWCLRVVDRKCAYMAGEDHPPHSCLSLAVLAIPMCPLYNGIQKEGWANSMCKMWSNILCRSCK